MTWLPKRLTAEFVRFGVIGLVGVGITNGSYDLLRNYTGAGVVTATTIATIVATIVSYAANKYWSFRHRQHGKLMREFVTFLVLNGFALLIQDAIVAVSYYSLGLHHSKITEYLAVNVSIVVAMLFRFWSYGRWVWRLPAGPVMVAPAGTSERSRAAQEDARA